MISRIVIEKTISVCKNKIAVTEQNRKKLLPQENLSSYL